MSTVGVKKKSIFKRWWFWLIVIVVIVGLANMGNSEDPASKAAMTQSSDKPNDQKNDNDKESKKEEQVEEDQRTINNIGEVITTKNFKIGLEAVNKPKGNQFNKPGDGNEFVDLVLIIENISEKEYTVSSMLMFDAYQDGFAVKESLTAQIADNSISTLNGTIAAGKKLRGKLAYELPVDWEELEVDIDLTKLSFSNDGEIKIAIKNESK